MKNTLVKNGLTLFCLMLNLLIFAGTPGDNSDTGDLQGGDAPAPIGDYIWVLAIVVVVYAFLKFRAMQQHHIQG